MMNLCDAVYYCQDCKRVVSLVEKIRIFREQVCKECDGSNWIMYLAEPNGRVWKGKPMNNNKENLIDETFKAAEFFN